jgi:hypothetical protein
MRLVSIFNPLRGCNSDKTQHSDTPVLQRSVRKESRTRTRTKRLVRADHVFYRYPALKPTPDPKT